MVPDVTTEEPATATPYQLVLPKGFPQDVKIPASNPLTQEGVALGRMLFYEPRLSRNNTLSCGSCHQQSKAFTDGRALALGVDGAVNPRGTMSLANILWEPALNWDGAATSLETQARKPIENPSELHQSLAIGAAKLQQTDLYPPLFRKAFGSSAVTEENVLKALAQFERTLISANSRYDKYVRGEGQLSSQELAGKVLFVTHPDPTIPVTGADCMHCHNEGNLLFTSTDYTRGASSSFFNNGLDAKLKDQGRFGVTGLESDRGKFRAPTLRNIALTAPYMHDGRFQTLEEVLDHYSDHVAKDSPNLDINLLTTTNKRNSPQLSLTASQQKQVVAFLLTLTDSAFIQDKRFSDPFKP
ncbi:cytochrome-c peroxidase [Hymenobacter sp. BT635]|uniref:Cytochrome-c peroxidase n=1 Tax=Hymenobacter nitidus TaxID=2880929 RepID=A0ABS8ABP8_9BACT|nr:cytochrome c peroxidase [Hymenobacter nitidus]MCB2377848.1 cytochrome-c peroxidase [Hymenobacter nitidus]